MERDREQPLLAAALDPAADVEEGAGHLTALDDLDRARLLDDVQRRRVTRRRRDVDGRGKAARDLLERHRPRRVTAAGCGSAPRRTSATAARPIRRRARRGSMQPPDVEHAARRVVIGVSLGKRDPAVDDDRAVPVARPRVEARHEPARRRPVDVQAAARASTPRAARRRRPGSFRRCGCARRSEAGRS